MADELRDRILMLGNYPPPYGGIATHIRGLVPTLEDAGYAVHVLSPGMSYGEERIGQRSMVHRLSKDRRINLARIAAKPWSFVRFAADAGMRSTEVAKSFLIYDVARRVLQQRGPDVKLISAYMVHPWGYAGAMLAKESGVPLITTNFGELYQFRSFYRANRAVAERVVERSAMLLASSRHCGSMYESLLGLRDASVEVVPYGVEPAFFEASVGRGETRSFEGFPMEKCILLFVGRMTPEMGLDTWLSAIEILAEDERLHFVVVGAEGPLTPSVKALADRLVNRVQVRVNAPFDALPRYYRAADIVVAPSADQRTCMGVAIKEAMAAARAVIATNVGGIGEAVVPGETGVLVPPRDPVALASAVRDMAAQGARLDEMGRRGHERAVQLFTMEGTHRRLVQIMEHVIRRGPAPARSRKPLHP